jgi:hypothetical protein
MIATELMHSLCHGEHQDYRYHLPAPHAGSPTGEGKGVMNLFPLDLPSTVVSISKDRVSHSVMG